jgi:hypothetical protein
MLTSGVSNNPFEPDPVSCVPYPQRRKMKSNLSPSISIMSVLSSASKIRGHHSWFVDVELLYDDNEPCAGTQQLGIYLAWSIENLMILLSAR